MFSIVMPIDTNRLEQFTKTKRVYDTYPQEKEFILPTRSYDEIYRYLEENNLLKDVKLIPYELEVFTSPVMAFNIAVRNAKYEHIIITSPETIPLTDVLPELEQLLGKNVVCQVFDQNEDGTMGISLVNKIFRGDDPGMYFLAMFNKSDIEKINGWDMEFMNGYAYDDNDFGARWKRAGIPFEINEDIKALHQWHPRYETIHGGLNRSARHFQENTDNNITYCKNGLKVIK